MPTEAVDTVENKIIRAEMPNIPRYPAIVQYARELATSAMETASRDGLNAVLQRVEKLGKNGPSSTSRRQ
jgi:hypothetical protein